jgi:hypothetical protein
MCLQRGRNFKLTRVGHFPRFLANANITIRKLDLLMLRYVLIKTEKMKNPYTFFCLLYTLTAVQLGERGANEIS